MASLIVGFVILALVFIQWRCGETDLLAWFGCCGWDIHRWRNPVLFWVIVGGQFLFALGLLGWGVFILTR